MLKIVEYPHNVLKQKAMPVSRKDLGSELNGYLDQLAETMYAAKGVGLAAPQVSDLRRLIVVDLGLHGERPKIEDGAIWNGTMYGEKTIKMANPIIISKSEDTAGIMEGCLSFPDFRVKVVRSEKITVEYFTPLGAKEQRTFSGYEAIVVQHEIDHLNGMTIINHASAFKRNRYAQVIRDKKAVKFIY